MSRHGWLGCVASWNLQCVLAKRSKKFFTMWKTGGLTELQKQCYMVEINNSSIYLLSTYFTN